MLTKEEITKLDNDTLVLVNLDIERQKQVRFEASKHFKFDKIKNQKAIDFPPPNPEFVEYEKIIKSEMSARKLDTWQ